MQYIYFGDVQFYFYLFIFLSQCGQSTMLITKKIKLNFEFI